MRALVPALLVGLVSAACGFGPTAAEPNPTPSPAGDIVIASDLPLTLTPGAAASQWVIQLAISEHPKIGRFKLGYWPLDDTLGGTASQARGVQNVKKMISNSRVLGMVGPRTSNVAQSEIPVANAGPMVMLSPSNTDICLTVPAPYCKPPPAGLRPKGPNNYFRIAAPDSVQGRAMARYAVAKLRVKRAAAFNEWGNDGDLVVDSFAAELSRTGGQLVLRQALPRGTKDFTGFLAAAKARGAEAIYAVAGSEDDNACVAWAQVKRIFTEGAYFLGTDSAANSDQCLKDAGDNANGMVATYPDVDLTQSTDATVQSVLAAYRKSHGPAARVFPYFFAAYDCTRLLMDAIERAVRANAGTFPSRAQVLNAVADAQYTGVTGTYSFDALGDAISPLMSLYRVENGHWVYKGRIDASATPS